MGLAEALNGWNLFSIWHVSDDGLVFVGQGFDRTGAQQMWIARIPEPAATSSIAVGLLTIARRRS
jgi:hypothetical protein